MNSGVQGDIAERTVSSEDQQFNEELIEDIFCALVDKPDNLHFNWVRNGRSCLLEISYRKTEGQESEIGKILGKRGQMIAALRLICAGVLRSRRGSNFIIQVLV